MNILMVTPWYKPHIGGVVETVVNLSRNLSQNGHKVTILVYGQTDSPELIESSDNLEAYLMNIRAPQFEKFSIKEAAAFYLYKARTRRILRKFIDEKKFDIINVHFPYTNHIYFAELSREMNKKLVVSVHGSDIKINLDKNLFSRNYVKRLIHDSDALVACSEDLMKNCLKKIGGVYRGISEVIYGGTVSEWLEDRGPSERFTDEDYVLTVGALRDVKGIDIILKAWSCLKEKHHKTMLYLAGDGVKRDKFEKLSESLGLQKRVKFLGNVSREDLYHYYKNARFIVIPSRSEGFPLSALEGFALKKAIIASDVGGLPELITEGENGRLITVGDYNAFGKTIGFFLDNKSEVEKMGENGYRLVKEKFTWGRNAERYIDLFDSVLMLKQE